MFEETFLFSDTVAANIAFADPDAPPERDRAGRPPRRRPRVHRGAARRLRHAIGERGYSLSGGQRQRIAIARAILADPRVLILDDATSAVDPTKEHEIRDALAEVMRGRTTIVIAHRPATIALADRVVLLDDGRVIADGHPRRAAGHERALPRGAGGGRAAARPSTGRGDGDGRWSVDVSMAGVDEEDHLDRDAARKVLRRACADAAALPAPGAGWPSRSSSLLDG